MKSYIKTLSLIALTGILLITIGCSYDNSLYNARKYFNTAQNRALNQSGKPTPQAIDEYNKTIQKCGYILTERKNSSEADDALFLLAKALYYRGNSQYQAKDQFESLLRNFPNSPYAPEATLYLAKSYRQINDPDEAEYVLTDYIRQPDKEKWHPQALLLLADFAVQDKDNVKSQFWLERLLAQYPKSLYAKEASYLLGRNYFDQKDYANSLAQFQKVLGTRGISRTMKNDARYYIAL
ncbi:MAG: tetratricopeptide repeat protein, partial [Candidatus Cloacimonadaceae bacterium]